MPVPVATTTTTTVIVANKGDTLGIAESAIQQIERKFHIPVVSVVK
jgi:hypothetical protein